MTFQGKTYSLYGSNTDTDKYYSVIKNLTNLFLTQCSDEEELLKQIQRAGSDRSFMNRIKRSRANKSLISFISKNISDSLSPYTTNVTSHLKTLSLSQRFDGIIGTKEFQYHLYMIEIELVNRIYRRAFQRSAYKFALIAHCLRDFRPKCECVAGEYESVCKGCTKDCFIHLGSVLLKKYDIHPYISVSMDLEKLFKKIQEEHQNPGALGIACVPELAIGMRLCVQLGIPPVGIPLDANRCARWMKKAHESSFNVKELEKLIL
ncbi:MAG: hypothetical protein AMK71_02940 [Nitrospira bacterium SG8_35_4]|nr:MAG: hypothetical protein AMK71_02940 [Nitrospira bacterium SG8_35_4]